MLEFHGYQIKVYADKAEIYKNKNFIESAEDEEKAKKRITELETEESPE